MRDARRLLTSVVRIGLIEHLAALLAPKIGLVARTHRNRIQLTFALVFLVATALISIVPDLQGDLKARSLDLALNWRLAGPVPDPKVVILDIDERSLALMAPEHGRWPWSRSVMAEALAGLAERKPSSILLNVMYSDPDIRDKDGDALFQQVAQDIPNAVYPLVRLNKDNDPKSEVRVRMLGNRTVSDPSREDATIAVLFPHFAATHDKLGLINLLPDRDSVIRRYPSLWEEAGFTLKSAAFLSVHGSASDPHKAPAVFTLNWRNKAGEYTRISFVDFLKAEAAGDAKYAATLQGAHVVIGVSAPGISVLKSTPVSRMVDDNEIIATAIDDLKNDTYLRLLPLPVSTALMASIIIGVYIALRSGISEKSVGHWFTLAQGAMLAITLLSVSYTNYLVDLTDCVFVGLAFFSVVKLHLLLERSATRAAPTFIDFERLVVQGQAALVVGLIAPRQDLGNRGAVRAHFEDIFGATRVFFIDNAYATDTVFGNRFANLSYAVGLCSREDLDRLEQSVRAFLDERGVASFTRPLPGLMGSEVSVVDQISEALVSLTADLLVAQRQNARPA